MLILGIDPGLSGALSLVECSSLNPPMLMACIDVPTHGEAAKRRVLTSAVYGWLQDRKVSVAYIERAQAMPDQGASSGFIYGRAVGSLEATTLCAGIKLKTAEPSSWKRYFGLLGTGKASSLELARTVICGSKQSLMRAKDHNRAESMLIAVYGAVMECVMPRIGVIEKNGTLIIGQAG